MPRGASHTATAVCFFRAVEHARGPGLRALDDPFAARLLPPALAALAQAPATRRLLLGRFDVGLGVAALARYVVARHLTLDAALCAFAEAGGRQVVVLGAGLDARAARFGPTFPDLTFWEVDFPATQYAKRDLLARAGLSREATRFVPVDFEREALDGALLAAGLDRAAPTLFLWEGVTMYLAPEAVVATLEALARVTQGAMAGSLASRVVFDAWVPSSGTLAATARRATSRLLGLIGEPFKFSLAPDEAGRMLSAAGWHLQAAHDRAALATRLGPDRGPIHPDVCVFEATRAASPQESP
jgi:methyltransferase (TIGR00027 family)